MRNLILILFAFIFLVNINAQETQLDSTAYFNFLYNPLSETSVLFSQVVEEVNGGYLLFGNYGFSVEDSRNYVRKINDIGEELWFQDYDFGANGQKGIIEHGEQVIRNSAGNLILAYSYRPDSLNRKLHKLVEMDIEGNIIKTSLYGDTIHSQISRAVVEVDDGYVILGRQNTDEQIKKIALIKVDFNFNEVWRKYYEREEVSHYFLRKTPWDNGFLTGGTYYTGDEFEEDSHITKFDSEGNLEWENINHYEDRVSTTVPVVVPDEDNPRYIVLSSQIPPDSVDLFHLSNYLTLREVNEFGETNYKKIYTEIERGVGFSTAILHDDYIIATAYNNYSIWDFNTLMLCISVEDGSILWQKEIDSDLAEDRQELIKDLQLTTDGGYIMTGFRSSPGIPITWTLKTDSLGNTCGFANCDSISVVEVPIIPSNNYLDIESNDFRVYPNPAKDSITVSGVQQRQKYVIVNALGQQVLTGILTENATIDIQDLNVGMYYMELSNGTTSRFVVLK